MNMLDIQSRPHHVHMTLGLNLASSTDIDNNQ